MIKIDYQELRENAESTIGILENIAGFEPSDIDGDTVELRFETDGGFDTGCDVSIVDQCQKTADVVRALLDERERNQQYIKSRDQENDEIALTVGKLRVELEAEKQRAKDLFMENARLKSGIAGLIHLGIRYADVEVMRIAGDAQLSTPCTDSIINSIATGIRIKGE